MNRMLCLAALAAWMLSCSGTSTPESPRPESGQPTDPDKTWKILFIGNSLALDATYLLPSLLNTAGVKNIELTRTFHGGYTLPQYNNNYAGGNICAWTIWKPGQARWRGNQTLSYSPKAVVEADTYDIICIQEYTGASACWEWTASEKISVTGLISKIRDSQRLKGNDDPRFVYLFSTQFGRGQRVLVEHFGNDPVKQFEANVATVTSLLAETGIKTVISTGALQQSLRTTGLNTARDFTRGDQIHMDYGAMRYAAACLLFKTLVTPLTGIEAENIPFNFEEYFPHPSAYTTPVTPETRPVLFAAVQAAYDHPLAITDLGSYTVSPAYTHKTGSVMLDEGDEVEPVTFPVAFPVGNAVNDTYKQPYWAGYGIWFSVDQPQAYAKWNIATYPGGVTPTRTFAKDNPSASSPAVQGIGAGDYFEFVIPVERLEAGSRIRFTAPFHTDGAVTFWAFEWLDGGTWKDGCTDITLDGTTRKASFALAPGETSVSCTATFSGAVPEGKLRFRVRCVDCSDFQAQLYFFGTGPDGTAIVFDRE
ncbi:MAG: DUF4886 domain-containing protein [Bacteroidales bacterium]|nr:DUF4886 domain-containing protein [Bacteroidales bacterium]